MYPASAIDIKSASHWREINLQAANTHQPPRPACVMGPAPVVMMCSGEMRRDDGKAIGRKSQSSVIGSMFDIIQFYAGGLQEKFRASSEFGWL